MKRIAAGILGIALTASAALCGCATHEASNCAPSPDSGPFDVKHYQQVAMQLESADTKVPDCYRAPESLSPLVIGPNQAIVYWNLKLEEAVQAALANSKVMQDLGGLVLRSPATARTIHGPSIQDTDPRFGVEAALADFDAVFSTSVHSEHNDRALNNVFFGGGTRLFDQNLDVFRTQISKLGATGATYTIRNNTTYDQNNAPGNLFPSAWDVNYEVEIRQPLLQGAGVEFNRIAGASRTAGVANGVLIARVNTDISLADFELGVRDLVSNVENAYWDLYFAYRDLDCKVRARDAALESWRSIQAKFVAGRRGGEADKEAEAREQYFRFKQEVENAWAGKLVEGTQTFNGSPGGTLRGNGVRVSERRLRLLCNLPVTDGRLIRPAEEPRLARLVVDWNDSVCEALTRRVELRRQKWQIKRRELELVAAKNFLLPTLDAVGLYRWRGFGHDLLNPDPQAGEFDNAYQNLTDGKFQEWNLGMELDIPIGFRKGHAAVRNAQLQLARERAILQDQEEQIVHDLSDAVAEIERSYQVSKTADNRRIAAKDQVIAVLAAYEADKAPLYAVLDAQRRLADAESSYFASLVEYALAQKNVHFEKGSLLDYNQVFLAESPWPAKAYRDAANRQALVGGDEINYVRSTPPQFGQGPVPQGTLPPPMTEYPAGQVPTGKPPVGPPPGQLPAGQSPPGQPPAGQPALGPPLPSSPPANLPERLPQRLPAPSGPRTTQWPVGPSDMAGNNAAAPPVNQPMAPRGESLAPMPMARPVLPPEGAPAWAWPQPAGTQSSAAPPANFGPANSAQSYSPLPQGTPTLGVAPSAGSPPPSGSPVSPIFSGPIQNGQQPGQNMPANYAAPPAYVAPPNYVSPPNYAAPPNYGPAWNAVQPASATLPIGMAPR